MRTAEEILQQEMNKGVDMHEGIIAAINQARIELLVEVCNVAKTYKVGNSGSWYDAAVDKQSILNLLNQIK